MFCGACRTTDVCGIGAGAMICVLHVYVVRVYRYLGWARTPYLYLYTVYIRYFKQGNHHTCGHIRCVYTVLANPIDISVRMFFGALPTDVCGRGAGGMICAVHVYVVRACR
jgi:hypothetical protein